MVQTVSEDKTMIVDTDLVVSLRFTLKNKAGEILEDIMAREPVKYLHGSGNILPALEAGIQWLRAGDRKIIVFKNDVSPSGESYSIDVVIDNIREASEKELRQGKPEPKAANDACGPGCCYC
jgi:FKBP-type peptidyl-prolyl cis-trans isomerase SlyD